MTIQRVQPNTGYIREHANSGSSLSITLTNTPGQNNLIILAVGTLDLGQHGYTVSSVFQDGGGVTWTRAVRQFNSNYYDTEIWYGYVTASNASKTINVTLTGSVDTQIILEAAEYQGVLPIVDKVSSANVNGTTAGSTGTTDTTSQANELWVGAIYGANGGGYSDAQSHSSGDGFTLIDGQSVAGSGAWAGSMAFLEKESTSTGVANSVTTFAVTSSGSGCIATFKTIADFEVTGNLTVGGYISSEDINAYGFLCSTTDPVKQAGGGAILMGSGFTSPSTPPEITLLDAQLSIQDSYGDPTPRRSMRDVYHNLTSNDYRVHNGSFWIPFQGPTASKPTYAYFGQFYTDTTTEKIYVNTNPETGQNLATWAEAGPYVGGAFSGFNTLFLLNGPVKYGDGTYENLPAYLPANMYLGNLYATGTLYYHDGLSTFDSMDDLEVLKEIRNTSDEDGKSIIDPETISHLRGEGGFYDRAKMDGWHICVEKRLLERIESLEMQLSQIMGKNETSTK